MVRYIAEDEEDFRTWHEAAPAAYLALLVEGRISQAFPLRQEVQLGREKDNAIVVADHKVSRHHARLTPLDNNAFIINDLGSANGTYVNGVLIAQPTRLKDRDRIGLGDTVFLFTTTPPDLHAPDPIPAPQPFFQSQQPVRAASGFGPMTLPDGSTMPLWVMIGCMALVIVVLLFVLAMLLGVFVGRSQAAGLALLWLTGGL